MLVCVSKIFSLLYAPSADVTEVGTWAVTVVSCVTLWGGYGSDGSWFMVLRSASSMFSSFIEMVCYIWVC